MKNTRLKSLVLGFTMLAGIIPGDAALAKTVDTWDGTSDTSWYDSTKNEFVLTTAEQFAGFSELVNNGTTFQNMTVTLNTDIVLNSGEIRRDNDVYAFSVGSEESLKEWTPIGVYKGSSSRGFRGVFDGNNSLISGIYISNPNEYQGLFGMSYGCTIKNVRIENSLYISGNAIGVGGIIAGTPKNVGPNATITVDNCIVDAVITDNGQLSGDIVVGGIVGSGRATVASRNTKTEIENSCFKGVIDYTGNGYKSNGGGIIGEAGRSGSIFACVNEGKITTNNSAAGICDYSRDSTVINGCVNTGAVTSQNLAGGIAGDTNASLNIKYCYNSGTVSGVNGSGGIVSYNAKTGTYTDNYYITSSAAYGIKTADGESVSEEGAESVSENELKSSAILNKLNSESKVYVIPDGYNNGYPIPQKVYSSMLYAGKYTVTDLVITGTTSVDDVVTMEYKADGEAGALSKIQFKWLVSDTVDGTYNELDIVDKSLKIKAEYHKKYLKAILILPAGEILKSEPVLINAYNSDFDGTIEKLEIRGIFKAGNYLYFRYDSQKVTDSHIAEVRWYVSNSENGTYKEAGRGSSVKTEDVTSVKYYKVTVILVNGNEYTSPVVKIEARDAKHWPGCTEESFSENIIENNSEYLFTVDGHEFVLIDTIPTSDTARFKVIAADTYGKYVYKNMDDEGFTMQFPEIILKHVDKNVFWSGTLNAWGGYMQNGYEDESLQQPIHGFYPPSMEDFTAYKDIIGLKAYTHKSRADGEEAEPVIFGLRTNGANALNGGLLYAIGVDSENKPVVKNDSDNNFGTDFGITYEVRPMFYLGKDFFTDAALNSDAMGSKVIEMIRNSYDKEELVETYNKRILEKEFGYPCDYTITGSAFTQNGANIEINANIEAYTNAGNGTVVAAAYHEDGRILAVSLEPITIGKGENTDVKLTLKNLTAADVKSLKISIIGGKDGLVAVTKQFELK